MPTTPAPPDAMDTLFEVPPTAFVARRNELAVQLRKAGKKDEAAAVKALSKPSLTVWAVNQLARRYPDQLAGFLKVSDELLHAQGAGTGDETSRRTYQASLAAQREALDPMLGHVADICAEHGVAAARPLLDRIANNFRWGAIDETARVLLVKGQLQLDLEPPDFSALVGRIPLRPGTTGGPSPPQAFAASRARITAPAPIRPSNDREVIAPAASETARAADARRRSEARRQVQALKNELRPLETEAQRTRTKVAALASKRDRAHEAIAALRGQIDKAEADAKALDEAHAQSSQELAAEEQRLEALRAEITEAEEQAEPRP